MTIRWIGTLCAAAALAAPLAAPMPAGAKFQTFDKVLGKRPFPCVPGGQFQCPSSNPANPRSEWFQDFGSVSALPVEPKTVAQSGLSPTSGVVHLGDKLAFKVFAASQDGKEIDTHNFQFRWTESPLASATEIGPGCDNEKRPFCVLRAEAPTNGWGRLGIVTPHSFDQPFGEDQTPYGVVRQFVIEGDAIQRGNPTTPGAPITNAPVTLQARHTKGHKRFATTLRTDDLDGSFQRLVAGERDVLVFMPAGADDVVCVNGKRTRSSGRHGGPACLLKLREKGNRGNAEAHFKFKPSP